MQTDVLNLRIPKDEYSALKKMAERCDKSANALGAIMVRAAIKAVGDYEGPIVPLTLEFPHKLNIPPASKGKK